MAPIALQPPPDWLNDFPLSRRQFKDLPKSFQEALHLPSTSQELQQQLFFKTPATDGLQGDIDALVKVYTRFHTHAVNYRDNIFPSIISLARTLKSHTSSVASYYGALYSALARFKYQNTDDSKWAGTRIADTVKMVDVLTTEVTAQMQRLSENAVKDVSLLYALSEDIRGDKSTVQTNLDNLRQKKIQDVEGGITSKDPSQAEGTETGIPQVKDLTQSTGKIPEASPSPSVIIAQRNDLLCGTFDTILDNIAAAITTINEMQKHIDGIHSDFDIIRNVTSGAQVSDPRPYPDLLSHDPPQSTVIEQWGQLALILTDYIRENDSASTA